MKRKVNIILFIVSFFVLCFWVSVGDCFKYAYDLNKINRYYKDNIDIAYNYQDSYLSIHVTDMEEYKKEIREVIAITTDFFNEWKYSTDKFEFELIFYTSYDRTLKVFYTEHRNKIQVTEVCATQGLPKITELPELYSVKEITILNEREDRKVNNLIEILKENLPKNCKINKINKQ